MPAATEQERSAVVQSSTTPSFNTAACGDCHAQSVILGAPGGSCTAACEAKGLKCIHPSPQWTSNAECIRAAVKSQVPVLESMTFAGGETYAQMMEAVFASASDPCTQLFSTETKVNFGTFDPVYGSIGWYPYFSFSSLIASCWAPLPASIAAHDGWDCDSTPAATGDFSLRLCPCAGEQPIYPATCEPPAPPPSDPFGAPPKFPPGTAVGPPASPMSPVLAGVLATVAIAAGLAALTVVYMRRRRHHSWPRARAAERHVPFVDDSAATTTIASLQIVESPLQGCVQGRL